MEKFVLILKADLKNILRDKSLAFVLFVPIIFIMLLRYGIIQIEEYYQPIKEYYSLIVAFFCILTAVFPAWMLSFVMMDEKDQDVVTVMKIMPIAFTRFIFYRLGTVMMFSFLYVFLTLVLNSLIVLSVWKIIFLSFITSLIAPIVMFFIVGYAKNKIEAATMFKLGNTLLFLPVIAFFIDSAWTKITAIIPLYWTFMAFDNINDTSFYLYSFVSVLVHSLFIILSIKRMKRVF